MANVQMQPEPTNDNMTVLETAPSSTMVALDSILNRSKLIWSRSR